jgi:hypothetical protein
MTGDEIRTWKPIAGQGLGVFLQEIAAQLAEPNDHLRQAQNQTPESNRKLSTRTHTVVLVFLLTLATSLVGQGIAPPIAEYRGDSASGMFEIQNTTDDPMAVILSTMSFTVDEQGHVRYSPLAPTTKIKMGASSFVLQPHDNRMIFYKASFPTTPTSFSIIATMTKVEVVDSGMRLSFVFPHMVYVYQKEKFDQRDIRLELVNGVLRIHNLSKKLGRVESVQANVGGEAGGFPIYPDQTREVVVNGATTATVKFEDGFKVATP